MIDTRDLLQNQPLDFWQNHLCQLVTFLGCDLSLAPRGRLGDETGEQECDFHRAPPRRLGNEIGEQECDFYLAPLRRLGKFSG